MFRHFTPHFYIFLALFVGTIAYTIVDMIGGK